ncbi:MAG: NAD-dependent epimerase/dehydratase family protein [Actinomycetota bacterium]
MEPIKGKKILVTGVTGWVAGPLATSLAAQGNTVYGAARFRDPSQREPWHAQGVQTVSIDLEKDRLDEVPADLDIVLHFAVAKSNNFEEAFASNAHGSANLMEKAASRSDKVSFFHCSSTAVYAPHDHDPRREDDLLGDSHRPMPGMPTYSISKIAGEVLVQHTAKRLGVPTVIARLNVPYGDNYGWMMFHLMMMERGIPVPVHVDQPTSYTPIHADDIARSIPCLMSYASTPAEIVNWGGDQIVSIEDWCNEMSRLTGIEAKFNPTTATIAAIIPDLAKLHDRGFATTVDWRDGIRRQITASRPELLKA